MKTAHRTGMSGCSPETRACARCPHALPNPTVMPPCLRSLHHLGGALLLGWSALALPAQESGRSRPAISGDSGEEARDAILDLLAEYRLGTREVVRPEGMRRATDLHGWRSVGVVLVWSLLELQGSGPGPEAWRGLSGPLIEAALVKRASHLPDLAHELLLFASLDPAVRPRIDELAARGLTVDTRMACAASLVLMQGDDYVHRAEEWRARVDRARNGPEILWDTETVRIARTDAALGELVQLRRRFEGLETAAERCEYALGTSSAVSSIVILRSGPGSALQPTTWWSLRTLRALAREAPSELANALIELDPDRILPGPPLGAGFERNEADELRSAAAARPLKRQFATWLGPEFTAHFAEAAAAAGWPE